MGGSWALVTNNPGSLHTTLEILRPRLGISRMRRQVHRIHDTLETGLHMMLRSLVAPTKGAGGFEAIWPSNIVSVRGILSRDRFETSCLCFRVRFQDCRFSFRIQWRSGWGDRKCGMPFTQRLTKNLPLVWSYQIRCENWMSMHKLPYFVASRIMVTQQNIAKAPLGESRESKMRRTKHVSKNGVKHNARKREICVICVIGVFVRNRCVFVEIRPWFLRFVISIGSRNLSVAIPLCCDEPSR